MDTVSKETKQQKKVLILENIRSTLNVGAIFRTADAIGIDKIFLCGITPAPIDRFGRKRRDVAKSALGAEESVEWEHMLSAQVCVEALKKEGFEVVVLEQTKQSVDYKTVTPKQKTAVILGNEVDGVSETLLALTDVAVEIPMMGIKESLNVSVSAGILLYRLFDR